MNRIESNLNNLPIEEPLKSSFGLVAFFDILGYKQIIANNEIEAAASIVKRVLKKVTDFQTAADDVEKQLNFPPTTKYLAFSDSILVYVNYSNNEESRKTQADVFIAG